jgi:branched-chain amino acid transport system permease protein
VSGGVAGWAQALAFVAAGTAYPWLFAGDYMLHLGILVCLYIILTSSLNLIIGYTGQFAVAHASFYGVGAYGAVLLVTRLGLHYWLAWLLAIFLAGLCAWVIGFSTLRLKGAYLAICTFAFSELFRLTLDNWTTLTNGANGIIVRFVPPGPRVPGLPAWSFDSRHRYYYLFWIMAAGTVWLVWRLVTSDTGRVLKAIRQDELLALTVGFPTMRYKLFAFVAGSMLAAMAGATYAPYISFIAPDLFDINETVYIMMIMMIGGIRTIAGPIWGAILLVSLPQILGIEPFVRMIVYGVILIIIMIRLPGGLSQLAGQLPHGVWRRAAAPRADAAPGSATLAKPDDA